MIRKKRSAERLIEQGILFLFLCPVFLVSTAAAGEEEVLPVLSEKLLKLSGYSQVQYTHWEGDSEDFRIRRARLGLKGSLLKNIDYSLQIDAVRNPVLVDARVDITLFPQAKLSFGQFKVPFSLENLTQSSALDNVDRTQTVKKICPAQDIGATGRDIGMTLSGKFSWIEYTFGVFNGSGINTRDMNDRKDVVGRLVVRPVHFLSLGVSHYEGVHSLFTGGPLLNRDRTGMDVFISAGQLFLKGEYILAKDGGIDRAGWYVRGAYSFIRDKLQAVVNYDSYDIDIDLDENRSDILTLGLNWFFSRNTKLQVNYEYHKQEWVETGDHVLLAQFQAGF
jgi:phosphate-selective porin OprO/OprP